jgi:hypothetical protein
MISERTVNFNFIGSTENKSPMSEVSTTGVPIAKNTQIWSYKRDEKLVEEKPKQEHLTITA